MEIFEVKKGRSALAPFSNIHFACFDVAPRLFADSLSDIDLQFKLDTDRSILAFCFKF
jgi:hypothetical protein